MSDEKSIQKQLKDIRELCEAILNKLEEPGVIANIGGPPIPPGDPQ